jgi:alpha/beta superfamily hydrolase
VGIEPVRLRTADGLRLEGELAVPAEPFGGAVLAHPHPLHGGSMRSIVTSALFQGLPASSVAALRFNFRGVEGSEGAFSGGLQERLDVVAALDTLEPLLEGLPIALVGWSFGADTVLCVGDSRAAGWVAVAPPLRPEALPDMVASRDERPVLLLVPEHDQFCPPQQAASLTTGWSTTELRVVAGADHFLVGRTDVAVTATVRVLEGLARRTRPDCGQRPADGAA